MTARQYELTMLSPETFALCPKGHNTGMGCEFPLAFAWEQYGVNQRKQLEPHEIAIAIAESNDGGDQTRLEIQLLDHSWIGLGLLADLPMILVQLAAHDYEVSKFPNHRATWGGDDCWAYITVGG